MNKKYVILAMISLIIIGYMDTYLTVKGYQSKITNSGMEEIKQKMKEATEKSIKTSGIMTSVNLPIECDFKSKRVSFLLRILGLSEKKQVNLEKIKATITTDSNETFVCTAYDIEISAGINLLHLTCDNIKKGEIKSLEVLIDSSYFSISTSYDKKYFDYIGVCE